MKKLIITAVLFVAAMSTGYAQFGTGIDQSFATNANVLSTLTVTNTNALDFYNVIQGANKTVSANTTTGGTDATYGTGQLADFAIAGSAGKEVGGYLTTTQSPANGANTLTVTDWIAWANTTNDLSGASSKTNPTTWANNISLTLDASGNGYMWVGATAQPTTTQAAGSYTIQNTFTVYYTGN